MEKIYSSVYYWQRSTILIKAQTFFFYFLFFSVFFFFCKNNYKVIQENKNDERGAYINLHDFMQSSFS